MPSQGGISFLDADSFHLSAESEAWGAIWTGGLADNLIVWMNGLEWLLHTHTSRPNDTKRYICKINTLRFNVHFTYLILNGHGYGSNDYH